MLKWIGLILITLGHFQYSSLQYLLPSWMIFKLFPLALLGYPIILFCVVKKFHHVKRPFCFFLRLGGLAVASRIVWVLVDFPYVGYLPLTAWADNLLAPLALSVLLLTGFDLASRSDAARNIPGAKPVFDGIPIRPNAGMALGILLILISFFSVLVLETDSGFYWMMTALFIYISYDREDDDVSLPLLLFSMVMLNLGNLGVGWLIRRSVATELVFCLTLLAVPLIGWLGNPSGKASSPDRPVKKKRSGLFVRIAFYLWYPALTALLAFIRK